MNTHWNDVTTQVRSVLADRRVQAAECVLDRWRGLVDEYWAGVPSLPGKPPKKRTGWLQSSGQVIDHPERDATEVRITAAYAGYLEFGTMRMAARPSVRPAIDAARPQVVRIMTGRERYTAAQTAFAGTTLGRLAGSAGRLWGQFRRSLGSRIP